MNTNQLAEQRKGRMDRLLEGTGSGGLLSTGYFSDGPLVDQLRHKEQADYALQNLTKGLTVRVDGTERNIEAGSNYRTAALVTDSRLLFVVGQADGDEVFSIPFSQINDVDVSTGILKDRITVHSEKGTYDMYVQKKSETQDIAAHVKSAAESSRTNYRSVSNSTTNNTSGSDAKVTVNRDSSIPDQGESDTEVSATEPADNVVADGAGPNSDRGADGEPIEASATKNPDTKSAASGQTPADGGSTSTAAGRTVAEASLLSEIRRVKDNLGQVPSKAEMSFRGQHAISQYEKVFGTWSEAVRAAGFEPRGSYESYSREELLEGLRDIASELQKPPSTRDINEHAPFSGGIVYKYFDSISDARAAAGVDDIGSDSKASSNSSPKRSATEPSSPTSSTSDADDASRNSADDNQSFSSDCPLADGLAKASEGRLSGVVVEVVDVSEGGSKRTAEVDVRTTADEVVVLDIWEKHDIDWSFEEGDSVRFSEVRLKRWETDGTSAHQLSTTKDFSATGIEDGPGVGRGTPVKRLTGLAGATKEDAEILVEAGYECREDLEAATLEELRTLQNLDDGVALRIKAELG